MLARGQPLDLRLSAGDLGPLGGHHRCRLTGAVFVGAETVVAVAYDVARIRLENLAGGGWLVGASSDAYREWGP